MRKLLLLVATSLLAAFLYGQQQTLLMSGLSTVPIKGGGGGTPSHGPPDTVASLVVWLDGESYRGMAQNATATNWYDWSTNANHGRYVPFGTGTVTIKTNGINTNYCVSFNSDGTGPNQASFQVNSLCARPFTIYWVSRYTNAAVQAYVLGDYGNVTRLVANYFGVNGNFAHYYSGGDARAESSYNSGQAYVWRFQHNSGNTTMNLQKNGANEPFDAGTTTVDQGTWATGTNFIGSGNGGGSGNLMMGEFIMYNSILSSNDDYTVTTYLRNKYGL